MPTQVRDLERCSGRPWAGGGRGVCHFLAAKRGHILLKRAELRPGDLEVPTAAEEASISAQI